MKHTRPPWSYTDSNFDGNDIKLAPYNTRFVIQCETDFKGVKGVIGACGYRLNAQLISAAPDLLKSLKEITSWVLTKTDQGTSSMVASAVDAIKKAES